ncbi:MAG: hypothetical protein ACRCVU_13605 [Flavobacterium sp.]
MKKTITLFIFIISLTMLGQDKIYYDANWKETTSKDYVYYRPLPLKKIGDIVYVQDYYKNGQLQYQGYSYADAVDESRIGDAYWYTEDGLNKDSGQYENLTKMKELTYYNQDGSIWKKINYGSKGSIIQVTVYYNNKPLITGKVYQNKYYGDFGISTPSPYYRNSKYNEGEEKNRDYADTSNKIEYQNSPKRHTLNTYWPNGNKAEQEINETSEYYGSFLISYRDKEGNLLSSFTHGKEIDQTKKYSYYVNNDFVKALKSETTYYKNNEIDFIKTTYYPNGKKKQHKIQKWKYTDIYNYDPQGNETVQKLKGNNPYEGSFIDSTSRYKITYYTLVQGKKDGEITTINSKNDSLITKGIYKNAVPYEGTFYLPKEYPEIQQYKNGKRNGLQQLFYSTRTNLLKQEYEMKDGVIHGYKKTYNYGELITVEQYKDGAPINATVIEGRTKKTYKDAVLYSIEYYKKGYNYELADLQYIEYYVNNVIDHVVYDTFRIIEDMRTSYTGYYKDEKPYSGYFNSEEIIIDKIPLINYYENGVLVAQYSFEFLEQNDTFNKLLYNQKATFKNGKVLDGYRYITDENSRGTLIKLRYKNSTINLIELNLFGMHAFKRIMFELKDNELFIKDFSNPTYIKISQDNKYLKAELYNAKGKILDKEQPIVKDKTPNSEQTFYIEDNKVKSYSVVSFSDEYYASLKEENSSLLISSTYYNFPKFLNISPKDYFSQYTNFVDQIINMKEDDDSQKEQSNSLYAILQNAALNDNRIAQLVYNDQGMPSQGINITYENNKYKVDYYLENKLLKTTNYQYIDELKEGKLFIEFLEIVEKQY